MIRSVNFCLDYTKFSRTKPITFSPGIHIIYGESGSGKTHLIRSLANLNSTHNGHFKVVESNVP
ncbi:MAG: hypothetical protein HN653_04075, partial [Candidatus Marinimicrobia bacterium]|nr:hypothetical protein [Candidatus Neomarinimicrobiota bacterium]